jgi:hypothetical protein
MIGYIFYILERLRHTAIGHMILSISKGPYILCSNFSGLETGLDILPVKYY